MMKKIIYTLILSMFFGMSVSAQRVMDKEALKAFEKEHYLEAEKSKKRAERYAEKHNIEMRVEHEDGTIIELMDVQDGIPVFYETRNAGAAITTRTTALYPGGSLGLNITGEGYNKVGIWDGGRVRLTHQEFNNTGTPRVTAGDDYTTFSPHATHVAGTMVAGGVQANAKGMAYLAELKSYYWDNAIGEMASAAADGMEISNHSWGQVAGWNYSSGWTWLGNEDIHPTIDYKFGYYSSISRSWDNLGRLAPYFLMVVAAGNDRGEGPSYAGTGSYPEKDGGTTGYDCIEGSGLSKNVLTVGAVSQVSNYTGPSSVSMSSFSSWGPTDDGRIKPDVVGKGVNVYSCTSSSNTSYDGTYSGTSMAAPNVTGTLVLLHQLYQQKYDETMMSSTIKGLAIHTADECGPNEGPDYIYGWGLLNAERAATLILEKEAKGTIREISLANGGVYESEVIVSNNSPLRATICWIDVEGEVYPAALNNRTSVLVNDLDLRIVGPTGTTYYPYKLDPENPAAAATKNSKNSIDNVEQVYIATPQNGTYKIIVDHDGDLTGGEQVFSLILSGIDDNSAVPPCVTKMITPTNHGNEALVNQEIKWETTDFATAYKVYFGTDGNGTVLPTNIKNGVQQTENYFYHEMEPNVTYYLAVQPSNSFGLNNSCTTIFSFETYAVNDHSYTEDIEQVTAPAMPVGWQSYNNSNKEWITTNAIGYESSSSFECRSAENNQFDNMLISPPIFVTKDDPFKMNFYIKGVLPFLTESLRIVWGEFPTIDRMTNEIYSEQEIRFNTWKERSVDFRPEEDGYIFIGFHLTSQEGRGLNVDNILLDNTIGVDELNENTAVKIHYVSGKIHLASSESYNNVDVSVVNVLGQQISSKKFATLQNETMEFDAIHGVYIVNVSSENIRISKKIIIK